MKRVIIVGSPRSNGRSAHIAEMLFEANIDERPEDELFLVPVSEIEVGPCIGCNACRKLTEVTFVGDDGAERVEMRPRCVFDDDMQTLYDLLDEADELTVVSPVYFSGAPGVLKCLLDRMQPYFWANTRSAEKRPATLHVLGEGGDPHGYGPLVTEVKSSLAVAGFRLERVFDWVGKVDERGEILADAVEVDVGSSAAVQRNVGQDPGKASQNHEAGKGRPKLDLSSGGKPKRAGTKPTGRNQAGGKGNRKKGQHRG